MTLLDAIRDARLFAHPFGDETWRAWRTLLAAIFAETPRTSDLERFRGCTGRKSWPAEPFTEAWCVVGRRGGKSMIAALVAVFFACFKDYRDVLAVGERGTVMVIAENRKQARVVFGYIRGLLQSVPMLEKKVKHETQDRIDLDNRVTIEVHTANFRAVRGYTVLCAILDEVAFWLDDSSANPDSEVVAALRPAMATVPGALLLGISSPYARRGVLWDQYKKHHGNNDSRVLVWKAPTRAMNPSVPASVIDQAMADDPAKAGAEYGAEFRTDVERFLTREVVEGCVIPERRELPPIAGVQYVAFTDPSGGSSDAMTLAIGHAEEREGARHAVLDLVREVRPPFAPTQTVLDFAEDMRRYHVAEVTGDRYAGEWVAESFRRHGINYKQAEKPKSELYRELLAPINSGTVELLDVPKLLAQLVGLERRVARGGRESIDHAPGGHDDVANAVAGVVQLVLRAAIGWTPAMLFGDTGYYAQQEQQRRRDASWTA